MSQIQSSPEWGIPNLQVKISWFRAMLSHYCTYIIHTEAQNTFSDQSLNLDIIDLSLLRVLGCRVQIRGQIMMNSLVHIPVPLHHVPHYYILEKKTCFISLYCRIKTLYACFFMHFVLQTPSSLLWPLWGGGIDKKCFLCCCDCDFPLTGGWGVSAKDFFCYCDRFSARCCTG